MERFGLTLITAPVEEPVSLAEAKARLQVTIDDMDTDIDALIRESRGAAESEVGRAFLAQTWAMTLDGFPCGRSIDLPRPPLASVAWVKYYDADGVQQTLDAASYYVATGSEPGRLVLKAGRAWPVAELGRPESVEVRFTAGVSSRSLLSPLVVAAVKLIMSARWENPTGEGVDIPPAARRILNGLETGKVW